jgi:hypothetical protein
MLSENDVMRVIDGDTELLARPLHQLDELSVFEVHAVSFSD